MTLHQLFAATVCALLLTGCEDDNDQRIAAYKKCHAAGMDSREYIDGYGSMHVRCAVPGVKP